MVLISGKFIEKVTSFPRTDIQFEPIFAIRSHAVPARPAPGEVPPCPPHLGCATLALLRECQGNLV